MQESLVIVFWAGVAVVFYTYLVYPAVLSVLVRIVKKKHQLPDRFELPEVTLVVAAYNEQKVMEKKIRNSLSLDYPEVLFRVLVVSDGSTDRTTEIVERFTAQDQSVRLLKLPRTGKAGALNAAMRLVKSDIVVFTDANTMLERSAIKKLVRHFADPGVGCVSGRLEYTNPGEVISGKGESFYWRYETLLKRMESGLGCVAGANGALYAIRRELFTELWPGTINDDFTISMKVLEKGFQSVYEPGALANEEVGTDMESEFRRHVRDGAGHYRAVVQLWRLLNPFLGARAFVYWSHRLLRWAVPFLLLALVPINLVISGEPLYMALFCLQIIFYAIALAGLAATKSKRLPFVMFVPFYLCNLNLALLLGFLKAVTNTQEAAWERTERAGIEGCE